jgi:hypothetical protein
MDFGIIWLSFIIASVLATFVAFSLIVPSRIRKKPVDEREAAYKRARSWLVKAQLLWGAAVGMTGLAIGNHGLVLTGLIAVGWVPLVHRNSEISIPGRLVKEDIASKYKDSVLGVLALFAGVALMSVFTMQIMAHIDRNEAEDAAYNQTVTYHLDADGRKLEGDTLTYPVSNLGTNISGDTYRWVERHSDGALVTQVVKKGSANKPSSGVIVKDDLPAADTEARVERITEYKVKGADIAAGKKLCAYKSDLENLFNGLPECADGMTRARFVKTQVIIHVPAGSADKMLPVVPD